MLDSVVTFDASTRVHELELSIARRVRETLRSYIPDPVAMEAAINQIPGVVSVGLFARRPADVVIVGEQPPRTL